MDQSIEKSRLRKQLLDARDSLSLDFIKIASEKIRENLRKIEAYRTAGSIGLYHSIGSEVRTEQILQEIWNHGKGAFLPKVEKDQIVFRKVSSISDLELGNFSVMEPRDRCEVAKKLDVILVPAIALSHNGYRLGYGFGFYDKYLSGKRAKKIALSYAKQIVKSFPRDPHDVKMDCIVTEDEVIYPR